MKWKSNANDTNGAAPREACRFSVDVEIKDNGETAKTAPISILARSGGGIDHWYWGMCYHDMTGMQLHKPRITLDYNHEEEEVIGFANHFTTNDEGLRLGGALTPFSAEDRASEIIYKARAGVPYEASITFDGPLVIEDVQPGAVATVNGQLVNGPATIFRQWSLRGCAVCPYGYDRNTSSELALSDKSDSKVPFTFSRVEKMSATATEEAQAVESQGVQDTAEETAVEQAAVVESASVEEVASPEAAPVETQLADVPGKKFLDAFGDKGAMWFALGKSFDDCQRLYVSGLKAEKVALVAEVAKLRAQSIENRGEEKPVSFSAEASDEQNKRAAKLDELNGKLTPGLARFAASNPMPAKKTK